jgi:hypothetical protein
MKYWKYVNDDVGGFEYSVISEAEIIRDFYPEWKQVMQEMGREDEISHDNCIQEWVAYYSAWQ